MSSLKILAAAVAAATVSFAMAQGVPPKPAATDPAVGAGQRSSQNTPMGTTGTPGGGGVAAQGSTAGSTAATTAGSTGASSSMSSGATAANSGSMASSTDTKVAKKSTKKSSKKTAKADRN